jgi:phage tail-like protein
MEQNKDEIYYPPVGFHFKVTFTGMDGKADLRFQSVSGLNVQMQTETFKEGGELRFEHTLPTRTKYSDLVLKRGILLPNQSEITRWVKSAIEDFNIQPKDLTVQLLGENHQALYTWNVVHAWPKNWKVSDLNAEKGEIVIETLELSINRFSLQG